MKEILLYKFDLSEYKIRKENIKNTIHNIAYMKPL